MSRDKLLSSGTGMTDLGRRLVQPVELDFNSPRGELACLSRDKLLSSSTWMTDGGRRLVNRLNWTQLAPGRVELLVPGQVAQLGHPDDGRRPEAGSTG